MDDKDAKKLTLDQRDGYDLFKDPGINAIISKLPEKQRNEGKKKGEYIYSKDYDKVNGEAKRMIDPLTFICEGMKSGLRPSHLDNEELELIRKNHGDKWYEKYGYTKETD